VRFLALVGRYALLYGQIPRFRMNEEVAIFRCQMIFTLNGSRAVRVRVQCRHRRTYKKTQAQNRPAEAHLEQFEGRTPITAPLRHLRSERSVSGSSCPWSADLASPVTAIVAGGNDTPLDLTTL
jgi:hypothetical protein